MTTPIYELCDAYAERLAVLDPVTATFRGIVGHDAEMTDYSPDGIASRTELDRTTLAQLRELSPENDRDRIAADLLSERLSASLALDDAGETLRTLRVIGSPFQAIRQVFDIMPRSTAQDWLTVAARMELVPDGIASVQTALDESARRGIPPARRQVLACAEQGTTWAGLRQHGPFFAELVAGYPGDDPVLRDRLSRGRRSGDEGLWGPQRMVAGRTGAPRLGSRRRRARSVLSERATSSSAPDRPRRNLPVGLGRASPDRSRNGLGREPDPARRHRGRGDRFPRI